MTRALLSPLLFAIAFLGALLLSGCDSTTVSPQARQEALPDAPARLSAATSEMHAGLATLRRATARYHRVETAVEDGFVPLPCVENPDGPGALGIPYVQLDRFDTTIDLEKPEVLFYEPQENGDLRLVGAEPVVPIAMWTAAEPPSLFGRAFHKNEAHGLYGLHMWVWRHNSNGVFAFWHPDVSCEYAE